MNPTENGSDDYIRVSEAKTRYLGGRMSLRWWYKQVETKRLTHHRAGGVVLLSPADIEAFIAKMRRAETPPETEPAAATESTPRSRPSRGGLRFFTDDN